MSVNEPVNVGLSKAGNDKLDELRELGYFNDKMDGYRFAVSLALAQGVIPPDIPERVTFLNVGSLDPDKILKQSVEALMPDKVDGASVYRLIECLADWGVSELHSQAKAGDINFESIFDQIAAKNP